MHVGRKDGEDKVQNIFSDATLKKMYDHSPHSVSIYSLILSLNLEISFMLIKNKTLIELMTWSSYVIADIGRIRLIYFNR